MQVTESIVRIQDLFDEWRAMGSERLRNGVELIGRAGSENEPHWLHAVFPGLSPMQLGYLEKMAGVHFPSQLRAFYRVVGGMTLFQGAFRVYGRRRPGVRLGIDGLQAEDIAELNHEIDALGWKPSAAVAFAVNAWDQTVHLAGMGTDADEIVRCDRATGRVLECHRDVFECVSDRLFRLDRLMMH